FFDEGRGLKSVTVLADAGGWGDLRLTPAVAPEEPSARVWDVAAGKAVGKPRAVPVVGYAGRVQQFPRRRQTEAEAPPGAVALSADGNLLATVSLDGGHWSVGNATDFLIGGRAVFHLWDVEAGASRLTRDGPVFGAAQPLRFSPDGRLLLTAESNCVCLLEVGAAGA